MPEITFSLNNQKIKRKVKSNQLLVDFIRQDLLLTGTHSSCSTMQCGACTVLIDGKSMKACSMLAVELDGHSLMTIEHLADGEKLHPIQQAFIDKLGFQCGYCTPGMIMATVDMLTRHKHPDEATIRRELSSNICRCTGYQKIVEAIQEASKTMHNEARGVK